MVDETNKDLEETAEEESEETSLDENGTEESEAGLSSTESSDEDVEETEDADAMASADDASESDETVAPTEETTTDEEPQRSDEHSSEADASLEVAGSDEETTGVDEPGADSEVEADPEADSEPEADSSHEIAATDDVDAQPEESEAYDEPVDLQVDDERVDSTAVAGVAAFFHHPDHLLYAAEQTRESKFSEFDAYSPFPIHGMDDAMGLGRSWIPWVTFTAGAFGLMTAIGLQFGIMGYDWPMVFGGKPFLAWPSFVPIMFELTVLFAGVTTGVVMLKAAGCFKKPFIIAREITNDQFVLWISAEDELFERSGVVEFMKELNPHEIRTVRKDG